VLLVWYRTRWHACATYTRVSLGLDVAVTAMLTSIQCHGYSSPTVYFSVASSGLAARGPRTGSPRAQSLPPNIAFVLRAASTFHLGQGR
jgi:hypothetical protein